MLEDLKSNRLSLINLLVNQFLLKNNMEPERYTYIDFISSYIKENKIKVVSEIPKIDEDFFLGVTVRSRKSICIFLNPDVYKRRFNFSTCHEIIHCIFDMNMKKRTQKFFNVDNNPSFYNEEEWILEKLANGAAGVIMIPDIKLVKYMKTNKSFRLISDECQISQQALHNRFVDFGIYSCGMRELTAVRATKNLQNYGDRSLFRMYLTGVHSTKEKQIIYDYENSI
ncbi:ImmA/IrrE family metallo-endopeptidase [Enterococcus raffinosus]